MSLTVGLVGLDDFPPVVSVVVAVRVVLLFLGFPLTRSRLRSFLSRHPPTVPFP